MTFSKLGINIDIENYYKNVELKCEMHKFNNEYLIYKTLIVAYFRKHDASTLKSVLK